MRPARRDISGCAALILEWLQNLLLAHYQHRLSRMTLAWLYSLAFSLSATGGILKWFLINRLYLEKRVVWSMSSPIKYSFWTVLKIFVHVHEKSELMFSHYTEKFLVYITVIQNHTLAVGELNFPYIYLPHFNTLPFSRLATNLKIICAKLSSLLVLRYGLHIQRSKLSALDMIILVENLY